MVFHELRPSFVETRLTSLLHTLLSTCPCSPPASVLVWSSHHGRIRSTDAPCKSHPWFGPGDWCAPPTSKSQPDSWESRWWRGASTSLSLSAAEEACELLRPTFFRESLSVSCGVLSCWRCLRYHFRLVLLIPTLRGSAEPTVEGVVLRFHFLFGHFAFLL